MPIYAYRCESCGHAKDVIQKFSDAPIAVCPACGADAFRKQLTAPAFQLKGSGWYVTDFRDGNKKAAKPEAGAPDKDAATTDAAKTAGEAPVKSTESGTGGDKPAAGPTPAAPAPSSAPSTSPTSTSPTSSKQPDA